MYACGLRHSEAVRLPISAVDSQQMLLRVIGKRNKERVLPLSEPVLAMLREVWLSQYINANDSRGKFLRSSIAD